MAPTRPPLNDQWWRNLRRIRRLTRTVPLFFAVTSAVLIGTALIWLGFNVFQHIVGTENKTLDTRADVLKTALSAVAGVGGAVALVVAYRRQKDLEEGRFVQRFSAAAAQLGDADPAVRIAGVYAMAGAADESTNFPRRQQCIDVLCGYMRLPYEPEQGSSGTTELVTTTRPLADGADVVEQARHQKIRHNDREVRQTIVRVIAAHLRETADFVWSPHNFDFTRVIFEDAEFNEVEFRGKSTSFGGATFSGFTYFSKAVFRGETTWFRNAEFSGENTMVFFNEAQFRGATTSFDGVVCNCQSISFEDATFSGDTTLFERTKFIANTYFARAKFLANTTAFKSAEFGGTIATFSEAEFGGEVTFDWTKFKCDKDGVVAQISFEKATFGGETISFNWAEFSCSGTTFSDAKFTSKTAASFDHTRFCSGLSTSFKGATFSCPTTKFKNAVFGSATTVFDKAEFSGDLTSFEQTKFDTISFIDVNFSGKTTQFDEVEFARKSLASFVRTRFSGTDTVFRMVTFGGTALFSGAAFDGVTTTFDRVAFGNESDSDSDSDSRTLFHGAKFLNKATVFTQPRCWHNVSFEWDHDREEMPACISPRAWPPPLLAES